MLVYYDTPKGDSYYGAAVAGPTFAKVMQDVLPYLGIERKYTEEEMEKLDISTPFLVGSTVAQAKNEAAKLQLTPVIYGNGETIISQIPEVSTKIPRGGRIVLYTDKDSINRDVTVPKLIGLSLAAANKEAIAAGLNISIKGAVSGNGITAINQSIPEGTNVSPGTVVTVEFAQKQDST